MKTPKAPAAPDPIVTAGAQTGTNVATAVANANLQNVNQVTPYGNLTYSQSGTTKFTDPTTGKTFELPSYTATQTLSESQGRIEHLNNMASENLATTAAEQSKFLNGYLGKGIDVSGLPARQSSIADAGGIQRSVANAGGIQRQIGNTAGGIQYGFGDAGDITKTYSTDFSADRQKVEDALMARLNPSLERDRDALQTQLSNQGIKLGSTAYDRGVDEYSRSANDARLGAILNAGQEQSRLVGLEANRAAFQNAAQGQNFDQLATRAGFANAAQQQDFGQLSDRANFANAAQQQQYGQNMSTAAFANQAQQQQYSQNANNAQFGNAARDGALQEQFALRNQPINEIASLMNGSQVQQPSFVNANVGAIPTVDYAGLVQQNYQNQMGVYQQQVASRNQMLGGILGLGGSIATAGIKASDRRLKRDIVRFGTSHNGLGLYLFRYIGSDTLHEGLMADEVERVVPDAVVAMAGGYKAVDYGKALA